MKLGRGVVWYVAHVGKKRNIYSVLVKKSEAKNETT
jgi:hypothetical protein